MGLYVVVFDITIYRRYRYRIMPPVSISKV